MRLNLLASLGALLVTSVAFGADESEPRYRDRWVYASHNMLVDKNVDTLISIIERAGKSGYNGAVLADYKFNILGRMPDNYFKNVERVKVAARAAGVELIPSVFPIGYSDGILAHDPNLAEGLPVKNAPFVARDGVARLVPEPAAQLVNGDLETTRGERFVKFSLQDDPGKTTFVDREVVHGGKASCRMQDVGSGTANGNCRLAQPVKVRPHACYRLSCWVKTKDLKPTGGFKLLALGRTHGRTLTFMEAHLKPTQDWEELDVVFNSLDENEVQLYAGQWSGKTGTIWVDDLKLEEVELVNVLRRDGCPFTVTSDDGKTTYEEGKDFEPVRDPKLGKDPYDGQIRFRHAGPRLTLTSQSRIKDGDRLRVSWYHPIIVHGFQVACCLADPKVERLMQDQAQRVHDLFKPKSFFMSHDEIRVAGWCGSCVESGKTPGELLAMNVHRSVAILRQVNPQARIVVWSDMFDPNHNAVDKYYLVNGGWSDSWKGLPNDVVIANWNSGKAAASLKWFADRGHPQILAGYYDHGTQHFKKWDEPAKGVPGVTGFMYTTWQNKYDDLEAYGKLLRGKAVD